jgi:proteasome lid subunit RPN8/RPN11
MPIMLQGLVTSASQLLNDLRRSWFVPSLPQPSPGRPAGGSYAPLQRILLTDGVGRTLFEEYAHHRTEEHGDVETGWVLLGLRESSEAVAVATLPAGLLSEASVGHIRFNSNAQAVGSRIVRQVDRRLTPLGVVHTHPGSLRHPSRGDLRGDRNWVQHLRGKEGVFAIGTADGPCEAARLFAHHPRPNVQCLGELRFSWYALRQGESSYRPLPVEVTLGPDLARDLHSVWTTLEAHAERIERLMQQQANVRVEVAAGPALVLIIPLAGNEGSLRVVIRERETLYLLERDGKLCETNHHEDLVDRGVYLLLAQLASKT